jgi:pimeloyl-ACP methyl ester carboxylesterase
VAEDPIYNRITVESNGHTIYALEQGKGPLIVALHGFPDLPISYRHQISALAKNGYRVVAPYMRGYFPSDAEPDGPYEVAALVQDVLSLIDQLTEQPAILIGHDWGAIVARSAAILAPGKLSKIVCMSVPTAGNFGRALVSNPKQQRRSWYMFFFQLPIAEMAIAHNDFAFIEALWQEWSPGWSCPKSVMNEIKEAFRQPSVLKAALAYYRSQFNPALQHPGLADIRKRLSDPIPVPTMYLHGANDGCIGVETTEGMESAFLRDFERHIISSAGHFVHQEQPEVVNKLITRFLDKQHK